MSSSKDSTHTYLRYMRGDDDHHDKPSLNITLCYYTNILTPGHSMNRVSHCGDERDILFREFHESITPSMCGGEGRGVRVASLGAYTAGGVR